MSTFLRVPWECPYPDRTTCVSAALAAERVRDGRDPYGVVTVGCPDHGRTDLHRAQDGGWCELQDVLELS